MNRLIDTVLVHGIKPPTIEEFVGTSNYALTGRQLRELRARVDESMGQKDIARLLKRNPEFERAIPKQEGQSRELDVVAMVRHVDNHADKSDIELGKVSWNYKGEILSMNNDNFPTDVATVAADNVWQYYARICNYSLDPCRDLIALYPMNDIMFIEFKTERAPDGFQAKSAGVLFLATKYDETTPEYKEQMEMISDATGQEPGWHYRGVIYWETRQNRVIVPAVVDLFVDKQGNIMNQNSLAPEDDPPTTLIPYKFTFGLSEEHDQTLDLLGQGVTYSVDAALFTLTLINCRGTELVANRPSTTERKRSRKRTGREPEVFRTLKIPAIKKVLEYAKQIEGTDEELRLHLVRGHPKTYRDDAPLLGQHVGTFFWQPQVRGLPEVGVVTGEYSTENIQPPLEPSLG